VADYVGWLQAEVDRLARENEALRAFLVEPPLVGAAPRSPKWAAVRDRFVKRHPFCAASGTTLLLEVHHVVPYHERPDLELDESNLIVLSRPYHFLVGHLMDWGSSNPNVREDAAAWLAKVRGRGRPNPDIPYC
jgi:hypothetical protein